MNFFDEHIYESVIRAFFITCRVLKFMNRIYVVYYNMKKKLTLSDSVSSASLSIKSYIEIRLFTCQLSPLRDAAMLDAAMLLAEYVEKSCSVIIKKKINN